MCTMHGSTGVHTTSQRLRPVFSRRLPPLVAQLAASGPTAVTTGPLPRARCHAAAAVPDNSAAAVPTTSSPAPAEDPEQYQLLRITGDGRCMFRALAQGAHWAAQHDAALSGDGAAPNEVERASVAAPTLLPAAQEAVQADALRSAVCNELLTRRAELEVFIDEDFDAYVRRMRTPAVWGGEPELAMATHVLRRPVRVFSLVGPGLSLVSEYGADDYSSATSIPLLFHTLGHYDLLLRQSQSQSQQQQQQRSKL